MTRVLLTGIDGFIGHHVAEGIMKQTDWEVIGLSRIDAASTLHRLVDMDDWKKHFQERMSFIFHDLKSPLNAYLTNRIGKIDYILHLAASTHVDRSIEYPMEFVLDNVVGTCNLLDYARTLPDLKLFVYFSTDEVFGPAEEGQAFREWDRYRSSNPYAATKAGGEELVYSYYNTYKLPIVITHTMNAFGERQHPEKFLPKIINTVLNSETLSIHADATRTKPGSRFYIHARSVAAAVLFLLQHPELEIGEKYNIVGEREVSNLELAQFVAKIVGRPLKYELVDFHSSRPGHDLRYALDGTKLRRMGFRHPKTFEESLEKTIRWYLSHPQWLLHPEEEARTIAKDYQVAEMSLGRSKGRKPPKRRAGR